MSVMAHMSQRQPPYMIQYPVMLPTTGPDMGPSA
jgi:hypothetical protein